MKTTLALIALLTLPACTVASETGTVSAEPEVDGFEATISGAYEGVVRGDGILGFLPGAGFEGNGYYFLADGQGIRPHGVTFALPPGVDVGRHPLESPPSLEAGTVFSVRVDRDLGDAVESFQLRTAGLLDLRSFPEDPSEAAGERVAGAFEFETEDATGNRITVRGTFSFEAD